MLHLYDRATMAHALTLDLDPRLRQLLVQRFAALATEYGDLTDWTEFLIIELGDTEADIVRHIGFSPLVNPVDGIRFGELGFHPHWDFVADRGAGWFEMIKTFGSTFAYILLIERGHGVSSELIQLCDYYAT